MSHADNTVSLSRSGVFLTQFLGPIQQFLNRDDVSEVCINQPGSVWVETAGVGGMEQHSITEIDERHIKNLAQQVAAASRQVVSGENPLLSAALPSRSTNFVKEVDSAGGCAATGRGPLPAPTNSTAAISSWLRT